MTVELRSRQAAAGIRVAVAQVQPRTLPTRRRFVGRRAFMAIVLAIAAPPATVALVNAIRGDDTQTNERFVDDLSVEEQKESAEREDSRKRSASAPASGRRGGQSQDIEGKAPALGTDGDASAGTQTEVSPAGGRMAFVSADPEADIYVMNLDGSGRRRLAAGIEPDWSPDGERIVFARGRKTGNCEYAPAGVENPDPCDVWVMRADGSNQRRLAAGFSPDWSPDGTRIAYAGGDDNDPEIRVMNADGSGSVQLTDGNENDSMAARPDWSPDGSRIAFGRGWRCDQGGWPNWCSHIEVMDATGADQHFVINGIAPSWSPDGKRIAYMGWDGNSEIYTAKADGSDVRRLTNDAATASTMDNFDAWPAWSQEGDIIFTRDPDGPPTRVPACQAGYSGSPTSAGAACGAGGPAPPGVFLMNADGSGRVRLGEGRMAAVGPW